MKSASFACAGEVNENLRLIFSIERLGELGYWRRRLGQCTLFDRVAIFADALRSRPRLRRLLFQWAQTVPARGTLGAGRPLPPALAALALTLTLASDSPIERSFSTLSLRSNPATHYPQTPSTTGLSTRFRALSRCPSHFHCPNCMSVEIFLRKSIKKNLNLYKKKIFLNSIKKKSKIFENKNCLTVCKLEHKRGSFPVGKKRVQKTLVAAIEAALLDSVSEQTRVGLQRRSEHKNTRVEAIGPADVGDGGKLVIVEQVVRVFDHQTIRVQEHTLAELNQAPTVQFGESNAQLWSLQKSQVGRVIAVQHIDQLDQVKHGP
ncbi:hypothetical protein BpHYR1_014761 [Brachionus plicatilis]|uniref:Uncharacterized protein n=1 Tax=Brachionus plicatilis TaxID=10195 RepID=A0A3M7SE18_BRAPC|nr:hypothetical protein BpHYR1_014761 [Brachionus plicatilis]